MKNKITIRKYWINIVNRIIKGIRGDKMVKRIKLANLPTKIEKLDRLSKELDKNIYIKEMIKQG